jgi:hypothetical protein
MYSKMQGISRLLELAQWCEEEEFCMEVFCWSSIEIVYTGNTKKQLLSDFCSAKYLQYICHVSYDDRAQP